MKLEKYLVNAIIGPGKALRLPMISERYELQ